MHLRVGDTSCPEDSWGENSHTSDTNPLLHDLKPDDKLYTAASVELARADAEEHGKVGLGFGSLAFELGNVTDILELGLGFAQVLSGLTSKSSENVASFLLTAHLDEPTG